MMSVGGEVKVTHSSSKWVSNNLSQKWLVSISTILWAMYLLSLFHSCKPTYSSYIHKPLLCLFLLCILALRSGITECMKEPLTYTVHPVIDSHHIFAHLKTDKDQRLYLSTEAPDVCRWIREPSSDWFSTMKSSSTCWASISYWLRVWHHNNHNIYINRSDSSKQQSMITIQRPQNITN